MPIEEFQCEPAPDFTPKTIQGIVCRLIDENWVHIKKGHGMANAGWAAVYPHILEETEELHSAIVNNDKANMREELADLYLLLVHGIILADSDLVEIERIAIAKAHQRFRPPESEDAPLATSGY